MDGLFRKNGYGRSFFKELRQHMAYALGLLFQPSPGQYRVSVGNRPLFRALCGPVLQIIYNRTIKHDFSPKNTFAVIL